MNLDGLGTVESVEPFLMRPYWATLLLGVQRTWKCSSATRTNRWRGTQRANCDKIGRNWIRFDPKFRKCVERRIVEKAGKSGRNSRHRFSLTPTAYGERMIAVSLSF